MKDEVNNKIKNYSLSINDITSDKPKGQWSTLFNGEPTQDKNGGTFRPGMGGGHEILNWNGGMQENVI